METVPNEQEKGKTLEKFDGLTCNCKIKIKELSYSFRSSAVVNFDFMNYGVLYM
jgi:hypothetical protein